MTPIAFTFSGVKVSLYYEDHNPIHFHAKYAEYAAVYELILENGKLVNINIREGNLPPKQNKIVLQFVKKNYKKIIEKWTDVAILGKPIKVTRISGL